MLPVRDYRPDHLYTGCKKLGQRSIVCELGNSAFAIDTLDHLILKAISADDFKNKSTVAKTLGIPIATLEFRLTRLTKHKIVVGHRLLIDTQRLGMQRMWIALAMKSLSTALVKRFFAFCEANPFVRYSSSALGAWDLDLGFDGSDDQNISAFLQHMYDEFSAEIADVRVTPIFRFLKVSPYPFATSSVSNAELPKRA